MFTAALFKIAEMGKQPKCPSMDECAKKMWCTSDIEMEILRMLPHKWDIVLNETS